MGDYGRQIDRERSISPIEEDGDSLSILGFAEPAHSLELKDYSSISTPLYSEAVAPKVQTVHDQAEPVNPWSTGIWARMPWVGLVAILTNITCKFHIRETRLDSLVLGTIVAVIVLSLSHGTEIENWSKTIQPSVWLSATSTLANLSLQLAFAEAVNIAFWRSAGKGASVRGSSTDLVLC